MRIPICYEFNKLIIIILVHLMLLFWNNFSHRIEWFLLLLHWRLP